MGCSSSTPEKKESNESTFDFSRRNTLVQRPDVPVEIGNEVKKLGPESRVVFIFGGPGSTKGSIVNDLTNMFDFVFISAETLILKHLPQKLYEHAQKESEGLIDVEPIVGTHGLVKALNEYPNVLTLEYVLSLVANEIKNHPGKLVLVDLIPNLRFLLRVKNFIKECDKELKDFENQIPIAFALNMTLTKEDLLQNIKTSHACIKPDHSAKPGTGQVDGSTDKGDEVDTGRTQRRFKLYTNSVNDFLGYFERADKVVKVDTSSAKWHLIWEAIKDFFAGEMEFQANHVINTVILFTFDQETKEIIDTNRYPMKELVLRDVVEDPSAPAPKLLNSLAKLLDQSALQTRCFLVDVSNTTLDEASVAEFDKSSLMFVDVDIGQLDYYVHGLRRKTHRKKSIFRKKAQFYKAISTSENETLLFPEETNTELCRRIAICLAERKSA